MSHNERDRRKEREKVTDLLSTRSIAGEKVTDLNGTYLVSVQKQQRIDR